MTTVKKTKKTLRPDTLLSSVAILLLVSIVQRSVGFGRGVLLCRWLEPDALGLWEMSLGFMLLASPIAVLGLPGSFGRYLVRYREQGQLRMFLRRTSTWAFSLAGVTVGAIAFWAPQTASIVFGDASQAPLMRVVALCIAAMITHHFFEAVFAGMRLYRVVSAMHFTQSMLFATISLLLVSCWQATATSVVIGYAAACGLSIVSVSAWALIRVERAPDTSQAPRHREFWPLLMRFAFWLWIGNVLANVFSTIDRYMILHYGGFDSQTALEMVGNYHASVIVPVLLVSVANLLLGAMTPHLSHAWESGHREEVNNQLNLTLKLSAVAMLAIGCGVLILCPMLFRFAFEGKYEAGLAVLPWTLAACIWYSQLLIAQAYILCAEKTRSNAWPLAVGIASNIGLNFVLLPMWGLAGAVIATGMATMLALSCQLAINRLAGMRVDSGVIMLSLTPLLLTFGVLPALVGLIVTVLFACGGQYLLNADEQLQIKQRFRELTNRGNSKLGTSAIADADTTDSPTI